jgi:acetoin utilization deacetylase AcuC-like enzyme
MITFYNHEHLHHRGKLEMFRGALMPCFEIPARTEQVREEIERRRLGAILEPRACDDAVLLRTHSARYIEFLRTAWDEWVAADPQNAERDALPSFWPIRQHRSDVAPENFDARLGLFSFDAGTPLTAGTWRAARMGAWCALSAVERVLAGDRSSFALTRPPGHHAGYDFFGGYCFINNAAVAAQALRDGGAERVAIVDVDYHHGNGTQALFYDRADVFYASIHGDPRTEYPFFLGHADETGSGAGAGCNLNLPLPRGTGFGAWRVALERALAAVTEHRSDALVVSLGVDTFADDPISNFKLHSDDYLTMGAMLARLQLPTVIVFEGGYDVAHVGINTVNVLEGFTSSVGRISRPA